MGSLHGFTSVSPPCYSLSPVRESPTFPGPGSRRRHPRRGGGVTVPTRLSLYLHDTGPLGDVSRKTVSERNLPPEKGGGSEGLKECSYGAGQVRDRDFLCLASEDSLLERSRSSCDLAHVVLRVSVVLVRVHSGYVGPVHVSVRPRPSGVPRWGGRTRVTVLGEVGEGRTRSQRGSTEVPRTTLPVSYPSFLGSLGFVTHGPEKDRVKRESKPRPSPVSLPRTGSTPGGYSVVVAHRLGYTRDLDEHLFVSTPVLVVGTP